MRDGALVVRCVSTPPPQPSPRSLRRSGLGVRDVVLVSGATSRTRIVNVPDSAAPLVAGLRDGWAESDRWTRSGPNGSSARRGQIANSPWGSGCLGGHARRQGDSDGSKAAAAAGPWDLLRPHYGRGPAARGRTSSSTRATGEPGLGRYQAPVTGLVSSPQAPRRFWAIARPPWCCPGAWPGGCS